MSKEKVGKLIGLCFVVFMIGTIFISPMSTLATATDVNDTFEDANGNNTLTGWTQSAKDAAKGNDMTVVSNIDTHTNCLDVTTGAGSGTPVVPGTNSATRTFTPLSGRVVVSFDIKFDNGFIAYVNDSTGKSLVAIAPTWIKNGTNAPNPALSTNTWYNLKFVINTDSDTFSFYKNGVLFGTGYKFNIIPPATEDTLADNVGQIRIQSGRTSSAIASNVYIDNLQAYYGDELLPELIIVKKSSNLAFVKGGQRYIDVGDLSISIIERQGVAMAPIEFIAHAKGVSIEKIGDDLDYKIITPKEGNVFEFYKESSNYNKNNTNRVLNKGTEVVNGKLYLPFTEVMQLLGDTVHEDSSGLIFASRTVVIDEMLAEGSYISYINNKYTFLESKKNATPTTYYVAQTANASDNNDGTLENPFATIQKAANTAVAGDTVIIKEGVYRETVKPENSGEFLAPITFTAEQGANVVITGAEEVNGWSLWQNNIYRTPISWDMGLGKNQVFINNKPYAEARHPNQDTISNATNYPFELEPLWPTRGNIKYDLELFKANVNDKYRLFSDTDLNQTPLDYWKGAIVVGHLGEGWTTQSGIVQSSQQGELTIEKPTTRWWFPWGESSKNWLDHYENKLVEYAFLSGHINALDKPGEWVIKDGYLYLYPPLNTDINTLKVEVKKRQLTFDLKGLSNIHIRGIESFAGSLTNYGGNSCVIDNCKFSYISHFTWFDDGKDGFIDDIDAVYINNDNNNPDWQRIFNWTEIEPNNPTTKGEVGIWLDGNYNVVNNSNFHYSAGAGLLLAGAYADITGNTLESCGYMGTYLSAIRMMDDYAESNSTFRGGHTIYYNTLDKAGRSLLSATQREGIDTTEYTQYYPSDIAYNRFSNGGLFSGRDGGTVYFYKAKLGDNQRRTQIRNNIIADNWAGIMNADIYNDNETRFVEYYNNIMLKRPGIVHEYGNFYINPAPGAIVSEWNNMDFFDYTKEQLSPLNYPFITPYTTGSNYSVLANGVIPEGYQKLDLSQTTALNNIERVSDVLIPTGSDGWFKLENIDFGTGTNKMEINYAIPVGTTTSYIEVRIDSLDGALIAKAKLNDYVANIDYYNMTLKETSFVVGQHDLYFRLVGSQGLKLKDINIFFENNLSTTKKIETEKFDNYYQSPTAYAKPSVFLGGSGYALGCTYNGNWVGYLGCVFTNYINSFTVQFTTVMPDDGTVVELRKDSPTGEVLATFTIDKQNSWLDYGLKTVTLNRMVEAGIYDLYLTFVGSGKTGNIDYLDFKLDSYQKLNLLQAISLNNIEIVSDVLIPTGSDGWFKLENIDFGTGTNKMEINYAIPVGITTSYIEVRIDSLDGALIAKAKLNDYVANIDYYNMTLKETSFVVGNHDLYFRLVGSQGLKLKGINIFFQNNLSTTKRIETEKFDNYYKSPTASAKPSVFSGGSGYALGCTYNGNWVSYLGCVFTNNINSFTVQFTTVMPDDGTVVELRKDSPTGEVLATFTIDKQNSWLDYGLKTVTLNRMVEAGIYDLYLTFVGGTGKTGNIDYLNFQSDMKYSATYDNVNRNIAIRGTISNIFENQIAVKILNDSGEVEYFDQIDADADGNFSLDYKVLDETNGKLTISLAQYGVTPMSTSIIIN